ncbi:MAG: DUF3343 domain-containing protein [Clostridia bacterium]|nr:DUF3343 domain-containing protein [Clostridia bacterium]MBR6776977.1 DUF3343 domain-containing protein [Clostridia bacterium]
MDTVLVLTSMTYASKAQETLKRKGINSTLTRSAQVRQIRGCGYGIQIDTAFAEEAERILAQNGIRIAGKAGVKKR